MIWPTDLSPQRPRRQALPPTLPPAPPRPSRGPSRPRRPGKLGLALVAVLLLIPLTGGAAWYFFGSLRQAHAGLVFHKVERRDLQLVVVERGFLESADTKDIVCRVKAGNRQATKINWVIDNGMQVKENEVVVELDSSAIDEQYKTQKNMVKTAENNYTAAEQNWIIVKKQNYGDIKDAEVALELAKIALEKYLGKEGTKDEGEYQQLVKDVEGRLTIARSDLDQWLDRIAWSERMLKKGFITASQAQSERARMQAAEIAMRKVEEEKRLLQNYTYNQTVKDLGNKVESAQRALERIREQARSKDTQARADIEAKCAILKLEEERLEDYADQIGECTIRAPHAGLVVYHQTEQSRYGSGSQQSIIAQGEPVQTGQKIMTIPDLSKMQVSCRIHEALITHVKEGQKVDIRIEAQGISLEGRVKQVATIAAQQDFYGPDVKVYQTIIAIEGSVGRFNLKPGMSAEVKIRTNRRVEDALAVPLQAVIPPKERGKNPMVLLKTKQGVEERKIEVGMNDDKFVQVKERREDAETGEVFGLEEGDEIVMNPRSLQAGKDKKEGDKAGADGKGGPGDKKRGPGDADGKKDPAPGGGPGRGGDRKRPG